MSIQFKQFFSALNFDQRVTLMSALSNAPTQKVINDIIDEAMLRMADLPPPSGNPTADAGFVATYLDLRRIKDLLQALQNVCKETQQEFLKHAGNQSKEH